MDDHSHYLTGETVGAYAVASDGCLVSLGRVPDRAPDRYDDASHDPSACRRMVTTERLMRPSILPAAPLPLVDGIGPVAQRVVLRPRMRRPNRRPVRTFLLVFDLPLDVPSAVVDDPWGVVEGTYLQVGSTARMRSARRPARPRRARQAPGTTTTGTTREQDARERIARELRSAGTIRMAEMD